MKNNCNSEIWYAYTFTKTIFYKVWRLYHKTNKILKKNYEFNYPNAFSYCSQDWFKKSILPSKSFMIWSIYYKKQEKFYRQIKEIIKRYLPEKIKRLLKKHLFFLFYESHSTIPKKISKEWDSWFYKRRNQSVDIINFSIIAYDFRFQRPQQLDNELVKLGHRVFYIENEFISSPSEKYPQINVEQKKTNLYTIKLSSSKNYFIYQDTPSDKDKRAIIASLKLLIKEARIINPVAKIDHPFWASIAEELSMPIIYDAMDFHAGFKENSSNNIEKEDLILQKSDLILASSDYIANQFKNFSSKTLLLRNAGEYSHFKSASTKAHLPTPDDIKKLKSPIIGYYGALSEWLNTDLIEQTAKDFSKASIVLIGRIDNKILESLARKYENIHLLGEKEYNVLPNYLKSFDVCLIPFHLSELIKATNPVKIYEYFAAGKPVVASSIPELLVYKKILYLADEPRSYSKAINKALCENSNKLVKERQVVAKDNTWKLRASILNKSLLKFYPKVSVVVLVYNNEKLSQISIESVLKRSKYPNLELIIVDNKSDNGTVKMLKKYLNIKGIKVIFNKENYGFAKGNNIGMAIAEGEYIILLNNDVRVTPGWIERLLYHSKANKAGLVGPATNSIGNESKISIFYNADDADDIENTALDYTSDHWGELLSLQKIAAFAWLMPRSLYKKIGNLDVRFGRGLFEDDDYCMRVINAGYTIYCADDSFVHHFGGASTHWDTPEFLELFNKNKDIFEAKWKQKWVPHRHRKN